MRKIAHNLDALETCTRFQGAINDMETLPLTSD